MHYQIILPLSWLIFLFVIFLELVFMSDSDIRSFACSLLFVRSLSPSSLSLLHQMLYLHSFFYHIQQIYFFFFLKLCIWIKAFLRSGIWTMDSIIIFKDHFAFKFVHGSRFPRQSKDKVFVFKMFVDLPSSSVELVKRMQVGGDM